MNRAMRRLLLSTTALIAFGIATASAQGANPNQPNGAPPAQQGASPATNEGVKPTQDQSGSSKVPAATDQQRQGEQAVSTPSGKTGKEEPTAHAPTQSTAVFVDGKLNVPGAPADSQTVPAKFSERNDKIDKLPIMAMPLGLSDEQRPTRRCRPLRRSRPRNCPWTSWCTTSACPPMCRRWRT
jgi:hypothetical protein